MDIHRTDTELLFKEGQVFEVEVGATKVDWPVDNRAFVRLAVTHSGSEPDADVLFESSPLTDDGTALTMIHNIVTEHGGYFSAFPVPHGYCFEVLLPRYADGDRESEEGAPANLPSVLLVEANGDLRRELQNFFEANNFVLLEASSAAEAMTLAPDLYEGSLDVAIAPEAEIEFLAGPLRDIHPHLKIIQIAETPALATSVPTPNAKIEGSVGSASTLKQCCFKSPSPKRRCLNGCAVCCGSLEHITWLPLVKILASAPTKLNCLRPTPRIQSNANPTHPTQRIQRNASDPAHRHFLCALPSRYSQGYRRTMSNLTSDEIRVALGKLEGWAVVAGKLHREYKFPDFGHAIGFMMAAAPSIERNDHHPEWSNVYNRVTVDLSTHDTGGITRKDVDLATLLEKLARRLQ